jgi:hypothetical protein
MRLSVNLEPEVHDFLSAYAHGRGITLSAAMNELLRHAEQAPGLGSPPECERGRLKIDEHGFMVVAANGHVLTPEIVKELSEDPIV